MRTRMTSLVRAVNPKVSKANYKGGVTSQIEALRTTY